MMKIAVVQLPGSNCDRDTFYALVGVFQLPTKLFWHKRGSLAGADAVIIPGGFSYGDYLRPGAIARFSPVIQAVKEFAEGGGLVLGFRCQVERLKVEDSLDYFNKDNMGETLRLPIAHGEGNYYIDPDGLQELEANQQILLRYENNPNGSVADIAAIRNKAGNVFGMMPHPERAVEQDIHPTTDGVAVLKAFLYQIRRLKAEDSEAASA